MASPQPAVPRATGLPSAHGARQSKAGQGNKNYSPHLYDCKGPGNANDCAGARLGTFLEDSNAGFMPSRRFLGLKDEKHPGKKAAVDDASHLNQQGLQSQKTRVRRSARQFSAPQGPYK